MNQRRVILGVDPGTTQSAYCRWDGASVLASGIVDNDELLRLLQSGELTDGVTMAAIEMIASYGMAVGREVFETCVWIGRFVERCDTPWRLVFRKDVKLHHCHSVRAKDANIRQALIDRFGPPGTKKQPGALYGVKSHVWAALAVATFAQECIDVSRRESVTHV